MPDARTQAKTPFLCGLGWHRYREVGQGQSIHRYLECARCAGRTVEKALLGYQPVRACWLAGGAWDNPPPPRHPLGLKDDRV